MKKIFLYLLIVFSVFQCESQPTKKNIYMYKLTYNIPGDDKIYIMERNVKEDTIYMDYFWIKNKDTLFVHDNTLTKNGDNYFLDGVTELKNSKSHPVCYKTIDNVTEDDSVMVCVTKVGLDTIINKIKFKYNIYEIYYSGPGYDDVSDTRLFFDINKGILIKEEYFMNESIQIIMELME